MKIAAGVILIMVGIFIFIRGDKQLGKYGMKNLGRYLYE